MISIFRRHSAPVLPVIDSALFSDIRPHPSPPTERGWKQMKVFPKIPNETDSPKHVSGCLGGLFTPYVSQVISEGDLDTFKGLLCNPITRIVPTTSMARLAVQHGQYEIIKFLHHNFGILPPQDSWNIALIREDYDTLHFLKAWSGRKHCGSVRGFLVEKID